MDIKSLYTVIPNDVTMDIKSLYTVTHVPNDEGLCALQYYLDKREILEPPTPTLLRMAELVLTLNTFEFNGEYYKQVEWPWVVV